MLKFKLHVKLVGNNLSSLERFPVLLAYTSFEKTPQDYAKSLPVKWEKENEYGIPYSKAIVTTFCIDRTATYPRDAAVWFHLYTDLRNSKGRLCPESGGYGQVYLAELMEGKTVSRDLIIANVADPDSDGGSPVHKGTVVVTVTPARAGLRSEVGKKRVFLHDALTFKPASKYDFVPGGADHLSQAMMIAINSNMVPFNKKALKSLGVTLQPNYTEINRVHAPIYTTSVTIPGETFLSSLTQQDLIGHDVLEHVAMTVLDRHGLTAKEFLSLSREGIARGQPMALSRVTSMVAEMCGKLSTDLPYIGDMADLNKDMGHPSGGHHTVVFRKKLARTVIEAFGDAWRKHAGDCEDLAYLAKYVYSSYAYSKDSDSALLRNIQFLSRRYVGSLMLVSVTARALGEAKDGKSHGPPHVGSKRDLDVQVGAHMVFAMIPREYMLGMLQWSTDNPDLRLPTGIGADDIEPWEKDLEVKMVEGTGRLIPAVLPDEAFITGTKAKDAAVQNSLATEDVYVRLKTGTSILGMRDNIKKGRSAPPVESPEIAAFTETQRPMLLINDPDVRTPFYRVITQIMPAWPTTASPTWDPTTSEGRPPVWRSSDGYGFHLLTPYRSDERPETFDRAGESAGRTLSKGPSPGKPIDNWGIDVTDLLNKRYFVAAWRSPEYTDEQHKIIGSLARHLSPVSIPSRPDTREEESARVQLTQFQQLLANQIARKTKRVQSVERTRTLGRSDPLGALEYDRYRVTLVTGEQLLAKWTNSYAPLFDVTEDLIKGAGADLAVNPYVLDARLRLEHEASGVATLRLQTLVDFSTDMARETVSERDWINAGSVTAL